MRRARDRMDCDDRLRPEIRPA